MKSIGLFLATTLVSAQGVGVASSAEIQVPVERTYVSRHATVSKIPRFVCNDYGRCWSSSLLKPEDYASGHLTLVNRVNRRAGYCMGYQFQYPVGWAECLGDWNYGRGRIYD